MARLSLFVLGAFRLTLDGAPLTGFRSNKVRALVAYLAVEGRPQARDHLAGLLWPEFTDRVARTYLRQALSDIRQVVSDGTASPPFVLADQQVISIHPAADLWVDAAVLAQALSDLRKAVTGQDDQAAATRLEGLLAAYRGSFLEGFSLAGCDAFQEWQLLTGEQIRRQVIDALRLLIERFLADGDYLAAQRYARRHIELEPWLEDGHRALMRALALAHEPAAALAHYDTYLRRLETELHATPTAETGALAEQIRAQARYDIPGVTTSGSRQRVVASATTIPFVAREQELSALQMRLRMSMAGQGSTVFITGDAGRGKSALLREFARRSLEAYPALLVAAGRCSGMGDLGDPLLPFREIMAQFTGDTESHRAVLAAEGARRLAVIAPKAIELFLHHGSDLVGTVVGESELAARSSTLPDGDARRAKIELLSRRSARRTTAVGLPRHALFDQYLRVLQALARERPLLILIDDLHWADADSLAFLFHLAQRLSGNRIMIAGAYRPEEVALGQNRARHPLDKIVREMGRISGMVTVDLESAPARPFVEACIDLEPNCLGIDFRDALLRRSGGNALFTVELMHDLKSRGGLIQDGQGCWIKGPSLDWDLLPARVESVISERIERLPAELRRLLAAASVQGEVFAVEIIAESVHRDPNVIARGLSDDAERIHHLIQAEGIQQIAAQRIRTYRFRHVLFQKYLYRHLDEIERIQWHEETGNALERLHTSAPHTLAENALGLAHHFEVAHLPQKALLYLSLAGKRANRMSAHEEAVACFERGLTLLPSLEQGVARDRSELDLHMGLGTALASFDGHTGVRVEASFTQAQALSRRLGDSPRVFQATWPLWRLNLARGEHLAALELANACLQLAENASHPSLLLQAHLAVATTYFRLGEMRLTQMHLAHAMSFFDPHTCDEITHTYGQDPAVSCKAVEAQVLWYLGYADQARATAKDALRWARRSDHALSLAHALCFAAGLHQRLCEPDACRDYAAEAIRVSTQYRLGQWATVGEFLHGWALYWRDDSESGLRQMQVALDEHVRIKMIQPRYFILFAEAAGRLGRITEALAMLADTEATTRRTGEREWETELYRVRGELLQLQGHPSDAEADFARAISFAESRNMKSLALRATISLARLWQGQGRTREASDRLLDLLGQFTEGWDAPDLVTAKALLVELQLVIR